MTAKVFADTNIAIVAAALLSDCETLYSEDLQHQQLFEGRLRVVNPFVADPNG